jgi:hypothetical protein
MNSQLHALATSPQRLSIHLTGSWGESAANMAVAANKNVYPSNGPNTS